MDARTRIVALVAALGGGSLTVPLPAAPQDGVVPVEAGEPLPRAASIPQRTARFLLYAEREGEVLPSSFLTRTVRAGKHDGADVVWIIDRYEISGRTGADTTALLAGTLAPLFYRSVTPETDTYLEFTPLRVTGGIERAGASPRVVDHLLEAPVYAVSSMVEVLQGLPLAEGLARRLRFFHPGYGEAEVTARVTGTERIDVAGEIGIEAWVIDIEAGAGTTTMWLRKRDAEPLRIRAPMPDGGFFWHVRLPAGTSIVASGR